MTFRIGDIVDVYGSCDSYREFIGRGPVVSVGVTYVGGSRPNWYAIDLNPDRPGGGPAHTWMVAQEWCVRPGERAPSRPAAPRIPVKRLWTVVPRKLPA